MSSHTAAIAPDADVTAWWSEGEQVPVRLGGDERSIFVRRLGDGPPLTLLHGYPSSSYQWLKAAPLLAAHFSLLMFDFLGFGASEKPRDHRYSLTEQTDLVEALWAHYEITTTKVAAHDYAVSVGQELIARRAEDQLSVQMTDMTLLNGGLYPELHRRVEAQSALLDPTTGPKLSAALDKRTFVEDLAPTFASSYDGSGDSDQMWRAYSRDDGQLNSYLLIHYITNRQENRDRWVTAHETTDLPIQFVWGLKDPISGAQIAARIKERTPKAPLHELPDVAHWPPIEAPERVANAIINWR